MRCDLLFAPARWRAWNYVLERFVVGESSQAASAPKSQILGHSTVKGFTENPPRFPTRARHNRNLWEVILRALRLVAATQRLYQPDDLATLLEARPLQRIKSH